MRIGGRFFAYLLITIILLIIMYVYGVEQLPWLSPEYMSPLITILLCLGAIVTIWTFYGLIYVKTHGELATVAERGKYWKLRKERSRGRR